MLWFLWVSCLGTSPPVMADEHEDTQIDCVWRRFEVTAYHPKCLGCSGITKSGKIADPNERMLAADLAHYPINTKILWMGEQYTVYDRGGGVRGPNRVDVLVRDRNEAIRWGRRHLNLCVYL
jgi:3D (Asp-Asp-Asp) domain-containing protein